ncbi:PREDICTED: uncharacterized protein LOC108564462 [Nicrophorus vespilloides]|uniref:Uncharacterized protein LOC108564462 n=1 Tax=Nicrophorus vespilloides TaxID=110193 RepID=A0ABM1MWR2_NICVS|nr:PREDICTED: uncharacterized protein LOC108564462 [Nicrophorus vespilloides]
METIWKVISCFVVLLSLELCCGLPIGQDLSYQDEHTQLVTGLIAVLLIVCGVVCLAGCLCCQRRNGFKEEDSKEFRDSPVVVSVASQLDHGHVNPIANGEFTIFTPLSTTASPSSPPNSSNVFSAHQQIISRAQEDYKDGDIDVSDWYGSGNVDFPRAKLKYIREVGRGWFGRVVEGTAQGVLSSADESAWSPVVVRILEATATNRQRIIFLHDASIYKCPSHPNILRLLGRSLENVPLLLLQEHCENGDLKAYLRAQQQSVDQFLTGKLPLLWCKQLTSAVRHLHEHDLIHPDLAARNCRLTHDLTLRLGDYGCGANDYPEDYYNGSENVPVRWCAPECVTCTSTTIQTRKVTRAGNVWSLGICFWEIEECAKQPYGNLTDDEVVSQVFGSARVRLSKPNCIASHADHLYHLMQLCWAVPESRPTANQIEDMLENIDSNDFNSRWDQMKPNIIIRGVDDENDLTNITVLNMGLNTDDDSQDGKYLSASMHNLAGSLDNLLDGNKSLDSWAEEDEEHTKLHFELGPLQKIQSSGSETEDENWKRKIELGLYTEKVRQKSRSVADLMILTHIDCSESDSETPLPSLGYKNVRCHNLENPSQIYGSEGNLLNVHTTFEEELKKLKEDRRDSLLFVPDKIELPTSTGGGGVYDSPESRRLLEDLNGTSTLEPQTQFFNVYNVVAISPMYSPIRMNYNNDHSSSPLPDVVLNAIPSKIPKLSEIIENNIAVNPDSKQVYKLSEDLVNKDSNSETSEFTDVSDSDDAVVEAKNEILITLKDLPKKSNGENGDVMHTETISIPKICESFITEAINHELLNAEKIAQELSSMELMSSRKNGDSKYPIEIIKEEASRYKLSEDEEDSENSTNENCLECLEIMNNEEDSTDLYLQEERSMSSEIDYLEEQLQLSELLNREQIESVSNDVEPMIGIQQFTTDDEVETDEDEDETDESDEDDTDLSDAEEEVRQLAEVFVKDIIELASDISVQRKEESVLPITNNFSENINIESVERMNNGYNIQKGLDNPTSNDAFDQAYKTYFINLTDDDKLYNIDTEEVKDTEKQDTASYNQSIKKVENVENNMNTIVFSKEKHPISRENSRVDDLTNDMQLLQMCWNTKIVDSKDDVIAEETSRNDKKHEINFDDCQVPIRMLNKDANGEIQYNYTTVPLVWPDLEKERIKQMLETREKIAKNDEEILKTDEVIMKSEEELMVAKEEITKNDEAITKTNGDIKKFDVEIIQNQVDMKVFEEIMKIEDNVIKENEELAKGQEEIVNSEKNILKIEEEFMRATEEFLKNDEEIVKTCEEITKSEEDIMKTSVEIIKFEADIAKAENEIVVIDEDIKIKIDEELVNEQKCITDSEKIVLKNEEEEILKNNKIGRTCEEVKKFDLEFTKEEDENIQNETYITSNEEMGEKVTELNEEIVKGQEDTQLIEGAIEDEIVSPDENVLIVDEEEPGETSVNDNSCIVYHNTINQTQDFLTNEISNYICDGTPKKNSVNFDLSNSQEEIKNSQFMFLKSSTPYKRDGGASTVILGASDDFSIDYYNGLKTTTVAASPTQDDSTFVHRKNDHLKYSLETWDNFLGKSFDEQQDRYTSDEPQSLLFLDDSIKSLPCDETYAAAAAKTYTNLNDTPVELDDINFEVDDGEEEEKSTYDNWDGGASGGWFLHPQTNGDDLTGQLEIPQDDSYVRFSMDDEVMAAIRNELLTKLPQAQRSAVDLKMDDVGEYETTDRNEVFIKYNVYNTPLSPIPEESHSELLHSGQSTPHCTINTDLDDSDSNDSDWSEAGSTGQHSLIEDECESPRLSPSSTNKEGVNNLQHRHTPSQESCCSNDTLFNLEELQCIEEGAKKNNNIITEPETVNTTFCVDKTCDTVEKEESIEVEDAAQKADDLEVVVDPVEDLPQQPDFVLKVDNTNCAEALTSLPVESSSSSETYLTVSDSLCYTLQNVAPLNSPEDRPWKHIEASLSNAASCDEEDQIKPNQDNLYENVDDTTNKNNLLVQQTEIYDYIEKAPSYVNDVVAKEDVDTVNPSTYVNCGNNQEGYVNCPETENVYDGVYEPVYDYCPLADIRFTGPSDSQMMTTSFSDSADLADERDWDSGSDTRSSSSGEFIWKEGSHEASVKALHAAPQDNTREDLEKPDLEDSSSCGSEEDGDGPEFVPSAWDKYATPTKSALRSPEKTLERSKGRGVSFKKQKYHCVYEYPREPDSPVIQSYDIWTTPKYPEVDWELETFMNRTDTKTSSPSTTASTTTTTTTTQNLYQTSNVPDFIGSSMLEDDFYISSSAKPFDVFGNNCQFFPGKDGSCEWGDLIKSVDNVTPDSGAEDVASVPKDFTSRRPTVMSLKSLAQLAVNRNKCKNIGGLRHTRDKLKLDLPPSPSAFTKGFTMEPPPVEPIIGGRQVPTFSTFGKSRFVVQHVDTPPSEENTKNVSFEALPYKPLVTASLNDVKTLVESVRGEASLLDSADEDSGIESCTLERRKSVS